MLYVVQDIPVQNRPLMSLLSDKDTVHCFSSLSLAPSSEDTNGKVITLPRAVLKMGSKGILPCEVHQANIVLAFWNFGSSFSTSEKIVQLDKTHNLRNGPGIDDGLYNISDKFSLIIHDVGVTDEGTYFCVIFDEETATLEYNHTDVSVYGM